MDKLGIVIKDARIRSGMKREELAAKLHVSPRHLMSIENGKQKPSYKLLYRLIRELSVPTDQIFYPEASQANIELERAFIMLRKCSDKELEIAILMIQSLLKIM